MQITTLHLFSQEPFDPARRGLVSRIAGARFDTFTLMDASGHANAKPCHVLVVRIPHDDDVADELIDLAEHLRRLLRLDEVGLEARGRYHRMTPNGAPPPERA